MHNTTLNDTVPNCLSDNILSVLFRVQVQFDAYVAQRDTRVGKRETADPRLDHILSEARDKGVGLICFEAGGMCRKCNLELRKGTGADRYKVSRRENCRWKRVARLLQCQSIHVVPFQVQGSGTGYVQGCHP